MKYLISTLFILLTLVSCNNNPARSNEGNVISDSSIETESSGSITSAIAEDSIHSNSDSITTSNEVNTSDNILVESSVAEPIIRDFFGTTLNSSQKTVLSSFSQHGLKLTKYLSMQGVTDFQCVKNVVWENITWDIVEVFIANNKFGAIRFTKKTNSEVQTRHYFERASNLFKSKYNKWLTDSDNSYTGFDDGKTILEVGELITTVTVTVYDSEAYQYM